MTEAEWLACRNPTPLLSAVRGQATPRKLRLFAVEVCRRFMAVFKNEINDKAVSLAERITDGEVTAAEFKAAVYEVTGQPVEHLRRNHSNFAVVLIPNVNVAVERCLASTRTFATLKSLATRDDSTLAYRITLADEQREQAKFFRDIFGNPFRPVAFDAEWRTPTAVGLARAIYDDRAFDRLPILADALQDAGCEDADILAHCRGDGPHVRGCWVVDLVLGKS